jgi:hypothetical protein
LSGHRVPVAFQGPVLNQIHKHLSGHIPHLVNELIDGRESRMAVGRFGDVVEAKHRHIVRNASARIMCRLHGADGRLIVSGKDRRRGRGKRQQLLSTAITDCAGEVANGNEIGIQGDIRLAQGSLVALQPLLGALKIGYSMAASAPSRFAAVTVTQSGQ